MSTAARDKRRTARDKIAAQQQAARRQQQRTRIIAAGGSIAAVLAIVMSLILVKTLGSGTPASTGTAGGTALPAEVTSVPGAVLNAAGTGTATPHTVTPATGRPLTAGGKPDILYVGAEYCPYCATERWPLAVALSRFGTFTGLRGIHSSATDVYPSQPTITFYKSSYTSKYLTFTPVETTTVNRKVPLQHLTPAEQTVLARYDAPPYVPATSAGAIPFIDLGGRYLINGAQYNPQVLQGHTWAQVAAALHQPSSPIGQGADGAANMITAALCKLTGNQPAAVCTAPAITRIQAQR